MASLVAWVDENVFVFREDLSAVSVVALGYENDVLEGLRDG